MKKNVFIAVGLNGAQLNITNPEGEVLHEIGLAAGLHPKTDYDKFIGNDDIAVLSEGATFVTPKSKMGVARSALQYTTGANPDFKPTRATHAEIQLRKTIESLTARVDTNERMRTAAENQKTREIKREQERLAEIDRKEAREADEAAKALEAEAVLAAKEAAAAA